MSVKNFFFFLWVLALLFSSCYKDHQVVHFASTEDSLHIILPLYAFPTDDEGKIWNAVAQAGYKVPITVIWGMSDTSDSAVYRNYLADLARAPYITLVAYVATGSGLRPAKEVKDKIKYYTENFDIQGIFLDEVNHVPEFDDYYKDIVSFARSFSDVHLVILNSSYAPPDYFARTGADVVVIFEDEASQWSNFNKQDYSHIPARKKAIIASGAWLKSNMEKIITQAVENNIGNVFVTNRGYDKLPGYWDKEVELVQEINTRE